MDNLKAEMQRNGLTVKDIMSTIGCSEKTARNKINGETDFTYPEAEKVRNVLFPGLRMNISFVSTAPSPPTRKRAHERKKSMGYEEIMAAIKDINGPWSNAACRGYCRMAMKSAGVDEKTQNDVLRELHFCMDTVSVEEAAREG